MDRNQARDLYAIRTLIAWHILGHILANMGVGLVTIVLAFLCLVPGIFFEI